MRVRSQPAQPCHFGPTGELFGLYHPVSGPASFAALLCPPLGQDMIRSHRAYRQLADALVAQGIAVLRFDYYGSGDSAGNSGDLDWTRCLADTVVAAAELRARSACAHLIGFGARLGGSIALSAAGTVRFSELLLWDPVLDGAACVAQLDALQQALQVDPMRFSKPRAPSDAANQWLGFPISANLRQQIAGLRIDPVSMPTHVFDSLPDGTADRWGALASVNVTRLPPTAAWDELDRLEHAILSPDLIRAVSAHLRGAA